jgi:hypothetical protein
MEKVKLIIGGIPSCCHVIPFDASQGPPALMHINRGSGSPPDYIGQMTQIHCTIDLDHYGAGVPSLVLKLKEDQMHNEFF